MVKQYYALTKPGIVYGNLFTTLAGLLFASRWHLGPQLLFATMIGLGLVIASACVFNNYIDRDIDSKMARTRDRALVSGAIPVFNALLFASVLGLVGTSLLFLYVNVLTASIALFGFIFYVVVYGFEKRQSHWGTIVGSISGAVPILVGYTAVANSLDAPALILFLILALWQMPHFYAIAMYRLDEYVSAGIPVLPAQKGITTTKIHIVFYIIAFLFAVSALTIFGYAGYVYMVCVLSVGLAWLLFAARGFRISDDAVWARKLFLFSLVVLVVFSVALSIASILP